MDSSLLRLSVGGREVVVELYSYVVDHDTGFAPNPYGGLCTLCRCKFRKHRQGKRNIVELAKVGDWVIGTGGANKKKSAGHGKLIYAMRVDEKPTREKYYNHFSRGRPAAADIVLKVPAAADGGTRARARRDRHAKVLSGTWELAFPGISRYLITVEPR